MLFDFKQERKIKIHKKKKTHKKHQNPENNQKTNALKTPQKPKQRRAKSRIHLLEVLCV